MKNSLFVRIGKEHLKLLLSEIIYIESMKNYIRIVTLKKKYMIKVTMCHIEKILPSDQFCRIHRCHIVSLHFITGFTYDNVHTQGIHLPVSDLYRKAFFGRVTNLESNTIAVIGNINANTLLHKLDTN